MSDEFKITVDLDPSVPVLHISGEITSEADEDIVGHYHSIPESRRSRVILNFQGTSYINSAGLATLISLITKASESSAKIEFAGLNDHFKKVMDIVGLTDFVLIHNTLQEALG
ncbi:anti-anti-sigma factor [Leptospira perolatii]|uniref:Anti-anti-sigma factor n=1 Tax=Leptospira perolatii TaxID=2023191 RepID=A0A2M9ZM66_9LEPT|nr:STAS domain-containing protein [Leptospira perolatii]PJZ69752.1 anti-anti-sigma factor [Leptospira perolatii]PJZ73033.1 anti-anti-sigma factor [Leptospira perolatii]